MLRTEASLERYLRPGPLVDSDHSEVKRRVIGYGPQVRDETKIVHDAFEFVRDQISHSWDIQSRRVTAQASEALHYSEGIC